MVKDAGVSMMMQLALKLYKVHQATKSGKGLL